MQPCSLVEFVQIWAMLKKWGPIPQMHREICDWLESVKDTEPHRLLQAYREGGKSYLTQLYVAWRLYLDPNYSCIIISAGHRLAKRNAGFIRSVLETHPLTQHLPDKELWQRTEFRVKQSMPQLDPSVVCLSLGSKITGNHCTEIIADDIEIEENVVTEEARESIRDAVEEMNTMCDRILAFGTPHHYETIYRYLTDELNFVVRKWAAEKPDGSPQAPDFKPKGRFHDAAWLAWKKSTMSSGKWRSQYLLDPVSLERSVLDPAMLIQFSANAIIEVGDGNLRDEDDIRHGQPVFFVRIGSEIVELKDMVAYFDPASGLRNRDNAVISVLGKSITNDVYILDQEVLPGLDLESGKPNRGQLLALLDVMKRNFCNTVIVEDNAAKHLAPELRGIAAERGAKVRVKTMTRTSTMQKDKIIADYIEPLLASGRLFIKETLYSDFAKEMRAFPKGRHDDRLDSVAGALMDITPTRVRNSHLDPLSPVSVRQTPTIVTANTYTP